MNELRSMKGLIEERFGALAFMEKLQRQPAQARLTQKLLDCGFSPALIRKLADGLPTDVADETAWAASVLERNLLTGEAERRARRPGRRVRADRLHRRRQDHQHRQARGRLRHQARRRPTSGLITLDAYRVGAHEQLRAYGRILGVPVHTAHDRASLEDLLELLSAQEDGADRHRRHGAARHPHPRAARHAEPPRDPASCWCVNAASQGETIEDVLIAYRAAQLRAASCCRRWTRRSSSARRSTR